MRQGDEQRVPVVALWDFDAAFPWPLHVFLLRAMRRAGILVAVVELLKRLYAET